MVFQNNALKVKAGKTKEVVTSGITKNGFFNCDVDSCVVCILSVKADYVLCVQCGKWINGRCAGLKNVTA